MITGIDINAVADYTCKDDKDNPTVWKFGVMTSCISAQMSQQAQKEEYLDAMFKVFRMCVKGWDNFNIPYKTESCVIYGKKMEAIPADIIDQIPMTVIMEVASHIMEQSNLVGDDRKN